MAEYPNYLLLGLRHHETSDVVDFSYGIPFNTGVNLEGLNKNQTLSVNDPPLGIFYITYAKIMSKSDYIKTGDFFKFRGDVTTAPELQKHRRSKLIIP